MTDCAQIREQLLEGDADTRLSLAPHLEACAGCRQLARAIVDADRDCQDAIEPVLSEPFIVAEPTRHTWRFTMPVVILATAASLALALLPGLADHSTTAAPAPEPTEASSDMVGSSFLIPWAALSESDWEERANKLLRSYQTLSGERTPRLQLRALAEIGMCAENANQTDPPFFQPFEGKHFNVAFAAAAKVELQHPGTLKDAELPDEVANSVRSLVRTFTDTPVDVDFEAALFRTR